MPNSPCEMIMSSQQLLRISWKSFTLPGREILLPG